ncbi:hypothetical protein L6R52_08875 [Myxococcota bacterium]|nr:hypothetical protein [Myxococcota bacterium]
MRPFVAAALFALLLPIEARAAAVVVFPLDGRGVAERTAGDATARLKATLRALRSVEVIETAAVEKRLGVHLTEQARACEYDVFCLVEVGEILGSERMIIGHVRKPPRAESPDELELKLFVLDVAKASVADVLLWRVPSAGAALDDAVDAATRRLFSAPNAKLAFELSPANAEVTFYGDPVPRTLKGPLDYWSGVYHARIAADGFQPVTQRIVVEPGGPTTVKIELAPDLLWVAKPKDTKRANPFAQPSRREGSGVSAEEAGALPVATDDDGSGGFANPIGWGLAGAGIAATVAGVIVSASAQSDYNSLSKQERYLPGVTLSAAQAIATRDDARSRYTIGSVVALSGGAIAASGLLWMIVDSATHGGKPSSVKLGAAHLPGVDGVLGSVGAEVRF